MKRSFPLIVPVYLLISFITYLAGLQWVSGMWAGMAGLYAVQWWQE